MTGSFHLLRNGNSVNPANKDSWGLSSQWKVQQLLDELGFCRPASRHIRPIPPHPRPYIVMLTFYFSLLQYLSKLTQGFVHWEFSRFCNISHWTSQQLGVWAGFPEYKWIIWSWCFRLRFKMLPRRNGLFWPKMQKKASPLKILQCGASFAMLAGRMLSCVFIQANLDTDWQ